MNNGIFGSGLLRQTSSAIASEPLYLLEVRSSTTWTATADGWVDILGFGAGGSGGVALGLSNSTQRALGGNAGGTAYKRFRVRKGYRYVITLGTGGASRVQSGSGQTSGANGGSTTIVGPGVNITIPGGFGGLAAETAAALSPTAATLPTGGDINLAGGLGGAIAADASTSHGATGGGCPNVTGTAYNGGDISTIVSDTTTGGAGVESNGTTNGAGSGPTAGGGVSRVFGSFTLLDYLPLSGTGSAGATNASSTAVTTFGAGSGSVVTNASGHSSGAAAFGGTGAITGVGFSVQSGAPTWGAGSGAATGNTANVISAKGGDAFALLAFFPE